MKRPAGWHYPFKLRTGDRVWVIAPSGPIEHTQPDKLAKAKRFLANQGLTVHFGDNLQNGVGPLATPLLEGRLKDFESALLDTNSQALLALTGGEHCNQLIPYLDYDLFAARRKIFCGHSDLTALLNAITAVTGVVTYYGPTLSALGSSYGHRLTTQAWQACLMNDFSFDLPAANTWYDKDFSANPPRRRRFSHGGWWPINQGTAEGRLIGGEISTLSLLAGSRYMPSLKNKILMLELYRGNLAVFDRLIEHILLQPGADKLAGLVIGKFQYEAHVKRQQLAKVLLSKPLLQRLPIMAHVDFGHTQPRLTLPIGGIMQMRVDPNRPALRIGEH